LKKVEKKGLIYHSGNLQLTKTEQEILHLITDEFLTLKQIAYRRQTSLQAVYKIIKKLKEKGVLNKGLKKVENSRPTFNQNDIRLHGQ
jgi:DNA-binding CsgD family transcriptional regulator